MRKHTLLSWLALGVMAGVCAFLAFQQFRWTGEISRAERDRLKSEREAALRAIGADIQASIAAIQRFLRDDNDAGQRAAAWLASPEGALVKRLLHVTPAESGLTLEIIDRTGVAFPAEWPSHLAFLRDRMQARIAEGQGGPFTSGHANLMEMPRFGPPHPMPRLRERDWLFAEINLDQLRTTFLASLIRKHLGANAGKEYRIKVYPQDDPSNLYFAANLDAVRGSPDAVAALFSPGFGGGPGPPRARPLQPNSPPGLLPPGLPPPGLPPPGLPPLADGRWQIEIRHLTNPLDSIVDRAQRRNLWMSLAMLGVLAAAVYALVRTTNEAQRLASLQMNFVSGMSHELRTPLTVISTAAYNLQGRMGSNPAQVEKYAKLIRDEAEKLKAIVEQVLQFSATRAGKSVRERVPVTLDPLIGETLQSSKTFLDRFRCDVETSIEPGLPIVLGDAVGLRHVIQNLLSNAAKYGSEGANWIGVRAQSIELDGQPWVEIRVADRGPGIPKDEQPHIFDAFYRGRQAIHDQIHGTGLGLNLVKSIVEAHGGTITVKSEPMRGAEFIVRLPAAPTELQDEFAHSFDRG